MQAQCHWHEECQCIQVCNIPRPATSADTLEIAAVPEDDSRVDSSSHPNVVDDYAYES